MHYAYYRDILTELSFVGDMSIHNSTSTAPTAAPTPAANNVRPKRPREADDDKSHSASPPPMSTTTVSTTAPDAQPRNIVGSRRVSSSLSAPASPLVPTPSCPPALFQLPMYSNELGRLPIYGQFNFSDAVGDPHARGPSIAQPPSLDGLVYGNFAAGQAAACGPLPHVGAQGHFPVQGQHDAYLLDPSFGSVPLPVDYLTGAMRFGAGMGMGMGAGGGGGDLSSLLTAGGGGGIDLDGMFGAMPAMDSDTMTMWTTAPTNLEYVPLSAVSWRILTYVCLLQAGRLEHVHFERRAANAGAGARPRTRARCVISAGALARHILMIHPRCLY